MKTAIVYYSLEGNTKYAAEKIAAQTGAELIALETVKPYPTKGFAKFYHGGKAASFGEKPQLKPYSFNPEDYDCVIIGCPVWAGKCAAPINTFMAEHGEALKKLGGENIGILLCQSGKGALKVIEQYKKTLGAASFKKELILIDPCRHTDKAEETDNLIEEFCRAFK